MAERTGIAWCDHTCNFWMGCTKVSPGCDHCYAEAHDVRFNAGKHWGPGAPRSFRLEAARRDIRKWNAKAATDCVRRRVFVNSLSDFFDNEVDQEPRDAAWSVFKECTALDFLLLSKRPQNMKRMALYPWALPNVWLGTTVVNQEEAERNIPHLLAVEAAVHYVSYEPALAQIDVENRFRMHADIPGIDWIIVGGESGHQARPFPVSWVRSILKQREGTLARVFVKQLGTNPLIALEDGFSNLERAPKGSKWDDPSQWPEWLRVQEFPR